MSARPPITVSEDGLFMEGLDWTLEAKIIHALVMRAGGEVTISAAEMAISLENDGMVVMPDDDGMGYRVSSERRQPSLPTICGMTVRIDPTMLPGTAELRDRDGRVLGRIVGLEVATPKEPR